MGLFKKLSYSFGAVATALSYQAFSTYIIFYYIDVMKLPAQLAALGMVIYGLWNAVNDPIFGFISDHTRSKWGRRIPYIALGAVPFGIAYYFLWVAPFADYTQTTQLFYYFVTMICLFDGFYTVTVLNWAALFPEMFPSLAERSEVNAYRQSFGMLGLILGIALPPVIYSNLGWHWMGAIFGSLISVSLLIALRGCRENMVFREKKQLALWPALKATFKNRSFLTFVFSNLFVQYTFTLILASIPFFAKYVLDVDPMQTMAIFGAAFLVAIPMLFVWSNLSVRFGAKRCFMTTILLLMLFLFPLFYVKTFLAALVASAFLGIGLAGFILIVDLLIAEVIDEDEVNTGTRREGMYFGMNAFVTRFAIGLEAFSMGAVFVFYNYNPFVFTQSQEFLKGLRLLIAGLPMIALSLAWLIILFYRPGEGRGSRP